MLKLKCNGDELNVAPSVKNNKIDSLVSIATIEESSVAETTMTLAMLTRENAIDLRDYLTTLIDGTN
jgi:hypothetical protein